MALFLALFIVFVFGAIILGAGAMLSPAWPTRQPRVGLAAAMCLALVVGGAVWWAELFGWDTLVINYLLFALVSGVVLGGTLSQAQTRAEAQGETLSDADQGWPGPQDLAFFACVAVIILLPVILLPVPFGDEAAFHGYLTLAARDGLDFNTLAPFYPDIALMQAPGFHAISAYLSIQLDQPIPTMHFAIAAVIVFMSIWVAYDLGGEIESKRLGRVMALLMLVGILPLYWLISGAYTLLLGLLFALSCMLYLLRVLREAKWIDIIGAGLMLGAVFYADHRVFVVLLLGYVALLLVMFIQQMTQQDAAKETPPQIRVMLALLVGVPLVALFGTFPWLLSNSALLISTTPFATLTHLSTRLSAVLFTYYGIIWIPLALVGAAMAWQDKALRPVAIWGMVWLLLAFDYAVTGIIPALLPVLRIYAAPDHITSVALFLPALMLGGVAVLWLWQHGIPMAWQQQSRRYAYVLMGAATMAIVLLFVTGVAFTLLRTATPLSADDAVDAQPIEQADRDALLWFADNAPADAVVLNHPTHGTWAAAYSQRNAIYMPLLDRYRLSDSVLVDRQVALNDFWRNPTSPDHAQILIDMGITHVIMPQAVATRYANDIDWQASPLMPIYQEDGVLILAVTS